MKKAKKYSNKKAESKTEMLPKKPKQLKQLKFCWHTTPKKLKTKASLNNINLVLKKTTKKNQLKLKARWSKQNNKIQKNEFNLKASKSNVN